MAYFFTRVDAVPIGNDEFKWEFAQWLSILVMTLNTDINDIQDALNFLTAPSFTASEIADLQSGNQLSNGVILYNSTTDEYIGRESGNLVKFTTTPYP